MPEEVRADLLLGRDTLSPGLVKAGRAAADASGNVRQLTRDLYEAGKIRATPVVDLQDAKATAKLADVAQKLRDLGAKAANPEIDLKDKRAKASLAALRVQLDKLGDKVSKPRITLEGLGKAEAELFALDVQMDRLNSKFRGRGGLVSGISGAVEALGGLAGAGPAIFNPITIAVGGLAAIMSGPLIASLLPIGIGFTGLAAIAVPEMEKVSKAVSKGGSALKNLSPDERALVGPMRDLHTEFGKLSDAVKPEILKIFSQGLRVIRDLMPALKPLIEAAAKAAAKFLRNLADWLESPSGKKFLHWLETEGPKDIQNFGNFLWTMAQVAGRVFSFLRNAGNTWWHNFKRIIDDVRTGFSNFVSWFIGAGKIMAGGWRWVGDQLVIIGLRAVRGILDAFSHIPLIGGKFRTAADAVNRELGRMTRDSRAAWNEIQSGIDRIHGKKVALTFGLNLPAGVSYPSRPIKGHAAGTPAAAAGWAWVGERGPELVRFSGGEHVLSSPDSMKVARGYASGAGPDYTASFPRLGSALERLTASVERSITAFVKAHATLNVGGGAAGGSVPSGTLSKAAIEALWIAAGGPGGFTADIAQAITVPESGRRPGIVQQGQPYATTGWGLWQITPGNSEPQFGINQQLLIPINNARAAVAKFRAAGSTFTPWTTYNDGAYAAYLDRGGWLKPGLTLAYNGTGRPEQVIPPGGRSSGGDTYNITVNVPPTVNPREAGRQVAELIIHHTRGGGRLYPAGVTPR